MKTIKKKLFWMKLKFIIQGTWQWVHTQQRGKSLLFHWRRHWQSKHLLADSPPRKPVQLWNWRQQCGLQLQCGSLLFPTARIQCWTNPWSRRRSEQTPEAGEGLNKLLKQEKVWTNSWSRRMLNKTLKQEKVWTNPWSRRRFVFLGFNLAKGKPANNDMLKIVV